MSRKGKALSQTPATREGLLRVLFVEHDTADVELCLVELKKAGFEVSADVVQTSAELAVRLSATTYDLVLADYRLPGWTGMDALALVQAEGHDIPFILVSGSLGDEHAVECVKRGASDYVIKEHLARLPVAVRQVLHEKKLRDDRARAVDALRDNEAKYRDLVNEINDGVFATDDRGVITFANRTLATIHGFERPEELLGRALFEFIAPAALQDVQEDFRRRGEVGMAAGFVTTAIVRGDGSEAVVEVTPTPIVVAGRIVGFRGVVRDVTDRKRLEEQFRQAQKMEAVGRLAGGVAHDFNNVLTAIMGYSDLLLGDLPPDSPLRQDVEEIRKAADRAAGLTRQLLAFSRKQILETRVLDLNALVADMDKLLRRLLGEDIDLATKLDPALGAVRADPGQLEQVIVNLAVNARDAMPEGGKLTIETRNAELDEAYADAHIPVKPGPYVMLAVSDTGSGMSEETQSHIFEPFFTTKEKGKGTGLGLATVYGIVKQSEGYIWCYSELGHGTTFKVYLPLVAEPAQQVARRPAGKPARGSETVLLVEDEEPVRTLARRVLETHGYAVLDATSGEQALALARHHAGPLHLLMTDVVLPGASGRKLADELLALRPDMKVLYMSGYTEDAIVHRGVLDPNTPFLHKPFAPDALARKVREVLDGAP